MRLEDPARCPAVKRWDILWIIQRVYRTTERKGGTVGVRHVWFCLLIVGILVSGRGRDIRGDLVLASGQSMAIESETVRVHGKVTLGDGAYLVVRKATLEIVQSYHEEFPVRLEGRARLVAEDAVITSDYAASIELWGHASLRMVRTKGSKSVVTMMGSSQVEIEESDILMLSIEPTVWEFTPHLGLARAVVRGTSIWNLGLGVSGTSKLTVRGLSAAGRWWLPDPGRSVRTTFILNRESYSAGQPDYEVTLHDCAVGNFIFVVGGRAEVEFQDCEIHQLGVYDSARVKAVDSWINQVALRLGRPTPLNVAFGGLRTGRHEDWRLTAVKGSLPCSLTLQRTTIVDGWYLRLNGGQYHVFDSAIARLRDEFDTPDSLYHIQDSCIREWQPWWNRGTVELENCYVDRVIAPDASSVTLRGNFAVRQDRVTTEWGPWRNNATITRWFPVLIYGEDGRPLAGAEVQLLDPVGRAVHTVRTDSSGRAEPGLRVEFNERNYTQQWTVLVPSIGQSQHIGLLSPTPIVLPTKHYTPPEVPGCLPSQSAGSGSAPRGEGTPFGNPSDGSVAVDGPLVEGTELKVTISVKNPVYVGAAGQPGTVRFAVRFNPGAPSVGVSILGYSPHEKRIWSVPNGDTFEEVTVPVRPCGDGWCGEVHVLLRKGVNSFNVIGPPVVDTISFGLILP